MTVGIVGLGLIGGSFAKAYAEAGETVLAFDADQSVLDFAVMSGAVTETLTKENLSRCDLILIAVYPAAAVAWLESMASHIEKHTVVIDCCGTKRAICEVCFPLAAEHGITFLGGHPMAGNHNSGFKYARGNLFHNAPMVIVPPNFDDICLLDRVKELLSPVGFGRFSVTTADEHDEMIAFTSQLAHVVSNAYIKSPTASRHKGFSAGSYKDMTRVAWLNPDMWAELCLENSDHLMKELDGLMEQLGAYRSAIAAGDRETLRCLLDEGKRRKEEVDGR
jgi:prephenate dehydrogenase